MATAIGLNMQLSASTSGLTSGINEAEKAIQKLGRGAESAAQYFERFRDAATGQLPAAMQQIVDQSGQLTSEFRAGLVTSEQYASGIKALGTEANAIVAAFRDGASVTAQYATEEERAAASQERLNSLLAAGAISQETYNRAMAEASGANAAAAAAAKEKADAEAKIAEAMRAGEAVAKSVRTEEEKRAEEMARLGSLLAQGAIDQQTYDRAIAEASGANRAAAEAERELARAKSEAASITNSVMTSQEKYDAEIARLQKHLEAGAISQETFNRAADRAKGVLDQASAATQRQADAAASASLQLNELSGFFSLLPGPIGNVAGRISGLASTVGGLDKLIANPTAAIANFSNVLGVLTSPLGQAVVGIAAFGAAATAVTKNLLELSDKVEKLSNQANKLGASFEFIQVLDVAAQRSGSSIESLGASFNRFLNKLDEAKTGSEKAVAAFARIGISSQDLANQKPEEIYKRMAVSIANLEDPAARAGVAMDILGRGGLDLIPTFQNIAQSEADMARFFATLSEFDKIRFEGFDASVEALETSTSGLGRALILPFVGLGDGIARGSAEFIGGITAIVKPIGQILEPAFTAIGRTIELFLNGIGAIGRTIGAILEPFGTVFAKISEYISPAQDAILEFFKSVQGLGEAAVQLLVSFTPVGLLADNFDAVAAAAEDFFSGFSEAASYVGDVISRVVTIVQTAFSQFAEVIGESLGEAITFVTSSVSAFLEFSGIGAVVTAAMQAVGAAFSGLWDTIQGIISGIGGFIEQVLQFAEDWLGISREIEKPVEAKVELDTTEPALAATMFYDEITKAVDKAAELGQEGVAAAELYQKRLEDIAVTTQEGTYSQDEMKRAVANATAEFEASLEPIAAAKKAREDMAKEAQKAADEVEKAAQRQIDADKKVADRLIENQRIDQEFGGSRERFQASQDLLSVENEIARVQKEQADAAAKGDKAAESAAAARLASLDQAKAAVAETAKFGFNQKDIDESIAKVRKDIEKEVSAADIQLAPDAAKDFFNTVKDLERQLELKIIDPKQFEEATREARKTFDEAAKQAEKVRDLQIKYNEEAAKIQEERLEELSKKSQAALQVEDIRTTGGASQFLSLATGREDPAIEEYRKQFKKLEEIRKEIAKAQQEAVEIL